MQQYQESSLKITYSNDVILSVDDMKRHLRVTGNDEDSLIEIYLKSAMRYVENYTRLLLLEGTAQQVFTLPMMVSSTQFLITGSTLINNQYLSLGIGNAISVTSITCNTESDLTTQKAITSTYKLLANMNKPRIYVPDGLIFTDNVAPYQITVSYTAGFAECDIPNDIKVATMLVCADMYENRINSVKQLPTAAEILLSPYVVNQGV